jgi:hypothetical protein
VDPLPNFLNAVGFFRQTFVIVFALALTEALKQFVAEQPKQANDPLSDRLIHWDRLPALLAFVFLLVPFFQGTVRYFYLTYESQKPFAYYDRFLVVDGVAFLIEAALFFAMSRAITPTRWRSLYMCIIWLLIADSSWGEIEYLHGALPTPHWIYLNIGLAMALGLLLWFIRTDERWRMPVAMYLGMTAVIIRTVWDYSLDWTLYFPAIYRTTTFFQ